MKVTKRQRNGLLILALGLGALAVDRLVLQPGVIGPKQASASAESAPAAPLGEPGKTSHVVTVAALVNSISSHELANDKASLDDMFSDPDWVRPTDTPEASGASAAKPEQSHTITGVVWGRTESIILDGELLMAGQASKSGRVLVKLDEARMVAIVRANGKDTELEIPVSMRPMRDRTSVPPVDGATAPK